MNPAQTQQPEQLTEEELHAAAAQPPPQPPLRAPLDAAAQIAMLGAGGVMGGLSALGNIKPVASLRTVEL